MWECKNKISDDIIYGVFKTKEEWLKNRKSRIGGSDAASILGLNPYKSNTELWAEKMEDEKNKNGHIQKDDISNNPHIAYGNNAEPLLRELFKLDYPELKVYYEENNMWLNKKYPFAHASLDGWLRDKDGNMGILEIKTASIIQPLQIEKWNDRIPDNYFCQLLHYFMVTEFDFAILKAKIMFDGYNDRERHSQIRHYKILRKDVEDDIETLKEKEKDFYEKILNNKKPNLILPDI